MMGPREEDLIGLALNWVQENNRNPDETDGTVDKTTDLLSEGVLDSVGFIDLLTFIETKVGCTIDLAELDPEDFMTVEGLCRHAFKNSAGGANDG